MRKHAALLLLGIGALLLTPGAAGVPVVPGDPTPPQVTPVITGTLGNLGWYTSNVTINWTVTDPESIVLSTTGCNAVTLTANTPGTVLTCSAESDGGTTTISKTFKIDKTAPAATATASRGADSNGWYNHELTVAFNGVDTTSGLASCTPPQVYEGPDTPATSVGGSCRDQAGNTGATALPLKYDETSPQASPSARAPDANGWYNHAVTVSFQGADGTSGVESCTQQTYAGPDDPSIALAGTCRDRAGNQSPSASYTLKYDETPPAAAATASRAADVNGWHNKPLTVSFAGSDATSGLGSCDAPKTYSGPDALSASVTGSCTDLAGNVAPRSFALKYDATAPATSATPSRQANANGWHNTPLTVTFAGTDGTSGIASCEAPKSYGGPDASAAPLSGTCTDQAGNSRATSFVVKYDATAPQVSATPARPAGANGWYNAPLGVTFAATDATAGVDTCDTAKTYSGPDAAAATVSGSCRDKAGNPATASMPLKYDATAPQVTASPGRPANTSGWYTAALSVSFSGGDATSGLDTCDPAKTYSGPDSAAASVAGTCRDKAGNTGTGSFGLKYDATAPVAGATASRVADANGWYNHPLTVNFTATDATAGVDACDAGKSYAGPDTASTSVQGACRDRAGNSASASLALKYDQTAPAVTGATPSRPADADGWHNRALTIGFQGTDATAGVQDCTQAPYSGPDSPTATVTGSCRDRAGNQSAANPFSFKYDATAPQVTASAARPADRNGWHNRPLTVTFAGTDATSGVNACDGATTYSGPDAVSTAIGGACRDRAGNVGSGSVTVKYDATGPTVTATPSRAANANGWYSAPLTVAFAGTDALSGLDSCEAAKSYAGPDAATASVAGTCTDRAGNAAAASLPVRYDATAPLVNAVPARGTDANGWYNHPIPVAFAGIDPTSGVESCSGGQTYAGPDTPSFSLSGSCRDRAGNQSANRVLAIKYDATPPQVTGALPVRPPDRAGWYNRPVAFAMQGTDATSGLDSCPAATYAGPDGAGASFAAACLDRAGNRATRTFPLRYDATGPATTATPDRGPDANGWYRQPVTVGFAGDDRVSGLESCASPERYEGPDGELVVIGGACMDKAGNVGLASLDVRYDATAPQVTGAQPNRVPDANGWYNHPLVVGFSGSDATSQIESCTQASYAGPDSTGASLTGSCRDRAGNVGSSLPFSLRYDSTAPSLGQVRVKAADAAAELSWTPSPDTALVEIRRAGKLVYGGTGKSFTDRRLRNGVRYRYTLTGYDEAANSTTASLTARPSGPLVEPVAGAVVSAPPRLAWKSVKRATHYHVQVWRQGRGRIFSAWPRGTSLQLPRSWTYRGRRYRLTKGHYRWYVWPGYGRKGKNDFGRLLGSSSFVVR